MLMAVIVMLHNWRDETTVYIWLQYEREILYHAQL
jgi:hypothetical protein